MQLAPVLSSVKWGVAHGLRGSWDSKRPSTNASSSVWHVEVVGRCVICCLAR